MYDKSIVLEHGLYYLVARDGDSILIHDAFDNLPAAQKAMDKLPAGIDDSVEDDPWLRQTVAYGRYGSEAPQSWRRNWFDAKMRREDLFESFLSRAENACCR